MEQRLIDVNALIEQLESIISDYTSNGAFPNGYDINSAIDSLQNAPTIDPETLPIVQELREKLWRVTVERDAAVWQLNGKCYACKHNDTPFHSSGQCEECRYRYYQFEMANAFDNWTWSGTHQEE